MSKIAESIDPGDFHSNNTHIENDNHFFLGLRSMFTKTISAIKNLPKVAAIQMCSTHNIDENLETARKLIDEAAANEASLIVLPENFALMGLDESDRLKHKEAFGLGKIQSFLATVSKENNIWLVGGTIPIAGDNNHKVRAACLVYNPTGNLAARYDKIHLFDVTLSETEIHHESNVIEPGSHIVVVDTPIGKVGLAICFDVRFTEHFRSLSKLGAEIIVLPSAFTVKTGEAHWEILNRCRAIDTFSYFIGAGQGGTHTNGRKTYGHSLIIDPWGNVLARKDDPNPGIIYSEINLDHLYKVRKSIPLYSKSPLTPLYKGG